MTSLHISSMKNFSSYLLPTLLAVIAFSASARAQFFAPEAVVTSDASVLNLGTTVLAFDVGAVSATINGVAFSGSTTASNGVVFSYTGFENNDFNGVSNPAPAAYSSNLTNILQPLHFSSNTAVTQSLSFANLTPGNIYQLQFFSGSDAGGSQTLTDGTATGTVSYGQTGHTYSIIETFTADSSGIETINYSTDTTYVLFNAVNLRDVTASIPEPSTYALLIGGLGLLALIGYQRRRFSV